MDKLKAIFPNEGEMISELYEVVEKHCMKRKQVRAGGFDQAASTAMSKEAMTAQVVGNMMLTGNSNSMHGEGQLAASVDVMVRSEIANFCGSGSGPDRVVFVDGGASANEYVLHTVLPVKPKSLGGGLQRDVLIIGDIEHPSLLDRAAAMQHKGYTTVHVPVDRNTGIYNIAILKQKLESNGERVAFVSTHHANNEIGTIQPVKRIGEIVKTITPNALFHVDCIQTLGKLPLEMAAWNADLISLSFHKVGGPKRCGAVVTTKPELFPEGYKATKDVSSHLAGLIAAESHINKMEETTVATLKLRQKIQEGIKAICEELEITFKELSSAPPVGIPGILSYLFPGMQGRHFVSLLSDNGVSVSSGAACSVGSDKPSKVISSLRVNNEDYFSAVRLSFNSDVTEDDVQKLFNAMRIALTKFKPSQVRELIKREYKQEKRDSNEAKKGKPNRWDRKRAQRAAEKAEKKANKKTIDENPFPPIVDLTPEELQETFNASKKDTYGFDAIMITLGELVLKGSNRKTFEKQMMSNIRKKLESNEYTKQLSLWLPKGHPQAGFVLIFHLDPKDLPKGGLNNTTAVATIPTPCRKITHSEYEDTVKPLIKEISGINTLAAVHMVAPDWSIIREAAFENLHCAYEAHLAANPQAKEVTFGVTSRRADKRFPLDSNTMSKKLGGHIYTASRGAKMTPELTVNLTNPELKLEVRVRQDLALVFTHSHKEKCSGGLPDGVDTNGRVLCLLSGGHDSPIACYKVIKRGCRVGFVHFDGYPYVGKEVVLKIRKLQEALNRHQAVGGDLYCVPFSKIQELIAETPDVPAAFRTVLYRVFMFKLSNIIAEKNFFKALCTGDNIGQVASQTLANMAALDKQSEMFVVRPLVTFTKEEIIKLASDLKIFEITKMYGTADCCTVFKPANPVLNTQERDLTRILSKLYEAGMQQALDDALVNCVTYAADDLVGTLPATISAPPASCPYEPKPKMPKLSPASESLKPTAAGSNVEIMDVEN